MPEWVYGPDIWEWTGNYGVILLIAALTFKVGNWLEKQWSDDESSADHHPAHARGAPRDEGAARRRHSRR